MVKKNKKEDVNSAEIINKITLKYTLELGAKEPQYVTSGSAGLDLYALKKTIDTENETVIYDTGVSVEIPQGYVGLLFPRSSVYKKDVRLANCVGVIDSDYRGTIKFIYDKFTYTDYDKISKGWKAIKGLFKWGIRYFIDDEIPGIEYNIDDKVGQLVIVPIPKVTLKRVDNLNSTERGTKGFGEADKQSE